MARVKRDPNRRRITRYGWRQLSIAVPRVWCGGTHVTFRVLPPHVFVGVYGFIDQDDGYPELLIGVGAFEIDLVFARMFTRRELRERRDAYAAEHASTLIEEIERHLGGSV